MMFYHPCTLSAVLSVCTLNSCDSHCEEFILRSGHTSSLQNLSTVSGQEAMGWIMTKVLGTLSFSSHGIPSPHVFLADPGAFPQDAAGYGPVAGQVPLSARQETASLSPASSRASSQADVGWSSGKHSVDTCDVCPPFQCLDLEFLCRLGLGKWPCAEGLAVQVSGYSSNVRTLGIQLLSSAFSSLAFPHASARTLHTRFSQCRGGKREEGEWHRLASQYDWDFLVGH